MIDNMEFGYTPNNLKALRQKYGLTQKRLADITGVSLATVQRWEAGTNKKTFASMPHIKWLHLLKTVENE